MSEADLIGDRVRAIRERLGALADAGSVKLMAVTKFQDRAAALAAIQAGVDAIGENRVQEAQEKWGHVRPPVPIHAIGHVQTNKVKYAIGLFDSIDTIDSVRISEALDGRLDRRLSVMVEVNVGREASKFGLDPGEVPCFLAQAERFQWLDVRGLMTVLPRVRDDSVEESRRIRQHMQEMANLWRMCRSEGWPWAPLDDLSMGMSGDWEWAVEAGATVIRLGSRIFGPRLNAVRD